MSSINSVRKLQILYFSKKNKKIKNLKNGEKSGPILAFIQLLMSCTSLRLNLHSKVCLNVKELLAQSRPHD